MRFLVTEEVTKSNEELFWSLLQVSDELFSRIEEVTSHSSYN
uniref:Uncharacterized protein n=1 Tax=Myoviridae sp. ctLnO19 TaxID=2825085 RepID=A0A8S5NZL7_9CAUD|nr:MAG TPA: hypothetical protein [Myoviridae sp. ctLnO19]